MAGKTALFCFGDFAVFRFIWFRVFILEWLLGVVEYARGREMGSNGTRVCDYSAWRRETGVG